MTLRLQEDQCVHIGGIKEYYLARYLGNPLPPHTHRCICAHAHTHTNTHTHTHTQKQTSSDRLVFDCFQAVWSCVVSIPLSSTGGAVLICATAMTVYYY